MIISIEYFITSICVLVAIGFYIGINVERVNWCNLFLPIRTIYKRKPGLTMDETIRYYLVHGEEYKDFYPDYKSTKG